MTVVVLCGSVRFVDAWHLANRQESLAGNLVFTLGCTGPEGCLCSPEEKAIMNDTHMQKIQFASQVAGRVLVLDVGGYVGEQTQREIRFANDWGVPVEYMSQRAWYTPLRQQTLELKYATPEARQLRPRRRRLRQDPGELCSGYI